MSAGPKLKTKSFSLEPEIGLYFFFPRRTYFLTAPALKPYTGPHLETSGDLHGKGREERMWRKTLIPQQHKVFMTTESAPSFVSLIRYQQSQCSQVLIWAVEAWECLTPPSLVACLFFPQHLHLLANSAGFHELPNAKVYSLKYPRLQLTSLQFTSFWIDLESLFQEPRWHSLPLFIKRLIIEAIMGVSAVLRNAWTKMQLVPVCREWMVAVSLWGESWFFGLRLPSPDNLYFWKLLRRL